MKIAGILVRRRVFVSLGLGVAVTGLWFLWSRETLPKISQHSIEHPVSFVRIVAAGATERDKLFEERALFGDPAPLFLPTDRNFQQGPLPSRVVKQPGQVFRDFEAKFHFVANTPLPEYGLVNDLGRENLAEILSRDNEAPFAGFGRLEQGSSPLSPRKGFIEVKALKTGLLSASGPLEGIDLPSVDFTPVEFVVAVTKFGLMGDPLLVATSGQEEVDGKLKDYLVNVYRIGARLAPGRYLVQIGP